jgi:hypothetical protein
MPESRAALVSDDIRAMIPADPALRARRFQKLEQEEEREAGQRPLADTYTRRSAPLAAVVAVLPKLIVRVRFPSPAPEAPAQLRG